MVTPNVTQSIFRKSGIGLGGVAGGVGAEGTTGPLGGGDLTSPAFGCGGFGFLLCGLLMKIQRLRSKTGRDNKDRNAWQLSASSFYVLWHYAVRVGNEVTLIGPFETRSRPGIGLTVTSGGKIGHQIRLAQGRRSNDARRGVAVKMEDAKLAGQQGQRPDHQGGHWRPPPPWRQVVFRFGAANLAGRGEDALLKIR